MKRDAPAPSGADLSVDLAGIRLANPVMSASGCFGCGREMSQFYDLSTMGAVVVKSVSLEARSGRPTPRVAETPSGMLNAIGLENPGVDVFCERDLPWLAGLGVPVIVSIVGSDPSGYAAVAERLRREPAVSAIEVNLSCPNVENRGLVFACSASATMAVVAAVRRVVTVPVFAKLTADVTSIVEVAEAALRSGADGLSLINTLLGLAIDVRTHRARLAAGTGGLSGPAIRPIAVRCVHQVAQAFPEAPIIGIGGIACAEDAVEFILAGATAVAIGTANFMNPMVVPEVIEGLGRLCEEQGVARLGDLRGQVRM
ncbi:MAG: dihydroorotate dehydrogenase [Actinomycetota bacterium]